MNCGYCMLAGLAVSTVIHAGVVVQFFLGAQANAVVAEKTVPVKLSMFRQPPPPVAVVKPVVEPKPPLPVKKPKPKPKPEIKPKPKPKPKKVKKPQPPKPKLVAEPEPVEIEPIYEELPEEPVMQQQPPPVEVAVVTKPVEAVAIDPGLIASLEQQYRSRVRQIIIEKKFYPMRARRQRAEGDVVVSFTINADGSIADLQLAQSASSSVLNRAALDAVKKAGKFQPFPDEIKRRQWTFEIPLTYRLN